MNLDARQTQPYTAKTTKAMEIPSTNMETTKNELGFDIVLDFILKVKTNWN